MLTRSIDDPFELSIKQKVFHHARRVGVVFAVIAVTIGGLDLMGIRPLDGAAEFVQQHRHAHLADWPRRMRQVINEMPISAEASPSMVVAIPRDRLAMDPLPVLSPPKVMAAKPTAAHRADAAQVAMASVFAHATLDDLARRAEAMARQARDMAAPSF